jgi:hypothetical protein
MMKETLQSDVKSSRFLFFLAVLLGLTCGWKPELAYAQSTGVVKLRISNQFGKDALKLEVPYASLHGDSLELTRFVYYLSNIELTGKSGKVWKQAESYHLLEVGEADQSVFEIVLKDIPEGEYRELSFAVGVDSVRNHSGKQVGALDTDNGMFWMWETGYVFLKVEGFFLRPSGVKKAMVYHIGRDDCYQRTHLKIPSKKVIVKKGSVTTLDVVADARLLFGGFPGAAIQLKAPTGDESVSVMGGPKASQVSRNYSRMFYLKL